MPTNNEIVNQIAKKFGMTLLEAGGKMVKSAFGLNPVIQPKLTIQTYLKEKTGLVASTISLSDERYHLISFEGWRDIFWHDFVDKIPYLTDTFDCDNFAFAFASRAAWLYNLNSCGICYGSVYNAETGAYIGEHAWNIIVSWDSNVLGLYHFEPMTDGWCYHTLSGDVIIGGWKYKPKWILMF